MTTPKDSMNAAIRRAAGHAQPSPATPPSTPRPAQHNAGNGTGNIAGQGGAAGGMDDLIRRAARRAMGWTTDSILLR